LDRRLYFPSEGRRAEDFFTLKSPTASAGFEPAILGIKGQHTIPPKPLSHPYVQKMKTNKGDLKFRYKVKAFTGKLTM
jgi:hypothetical protein